MVRAPPFPDFPCGRPPMAPETDMPLMMTEEAADDEVELDSPCCTTVRLARRFRKVLDDEGVVVFIRPGSSAKKKKK